jgi:hypothetical protein
MMSSLTAVLRVLACCTAGLAALPMAARSAGVPSYPLPTQLYSLTTAGLGPLNPAVIVGFNPQPDPPGFSDQVDLSNPLGPSFRFAVNQPTITTILFGMHGPGPNDPYTATPGLFSGVNSDHVATDVFTETGDGNVFQVTFDVSGILGDWSSFNPQPDPPGDFGFAYLGDTTLTVHIDRVLPNQSLVPLALVPEPASLGVLLAGLGALMGVRRRHAV